MADNVNIKDFAGVSVPVSTEDVTTLNGGVVATQQVQRVAVALRTADATAIDLPGDAANGLDVDVTRLPAVTNGGTFAVQVDGAALTALQLLDNCISGSEAQVDIVAALPAGTNNIGTVTPYTALANIVSGSTAAITDTTSTEVIAAPGAGVKILITSIAVSNSHATVGTFVKILSAATVKLQMYADAVGGGFVINLPVPIPCGTDEAVKVQCATTGANIIANVVGYKVTV